MQLRLKVIGGKNDGKEIEIKGEFVIGRGEGVNLRPKSDLISRKHCTLYVRDGRAYVNDLKSSNGTFLNGERIEGENQLEMRDRLRVGRLQFEVVLDHAKPSAKRPKVTNVRDAAVRSASAASGIETEDMDDSITDWLTEGDDTAKSGKTDFSETRQFRLDESDRIYVPESPVKPDSAQDETIDNAGEESIDSSAEQTAEGKKKGKKKPGKMRERPDDKADNSKDAASQMLRKFFNRS